MISSSCLNEPNKNKRHLYCIKHGSRVLSRLAEQKYYVNAILILAQAKFLEAVYFLDYLTQNKRVYIEDLHEEISVPQNHYITSIIQTAFHIENLHDGETDLGSG